MRYTYEQLLEDPEILRRIDAEARRSRAEAVDELIIEPVKRLFTDHAPRPHLARQG